ncbi:MAG: glycosyltransferase [Bacteroidota bacterium]
MNEEFPDLKKEEIAPYKICYSKNIPLSIKLILESPRILRVVNKEHQQLKSIIQKYNIDVVISDNRFGLYNSKVECIYITHQLNIRAGLFSLMANKVHHYFIKKFNSIWVPDFENEGLALAGKLSKNHHFKNLIYIGPLSRLTFLEPANKVFDYLCLLSGPEPLRTEFEKQLIEKSKNTDKKICIVRGTYSEHNYNLSDNVVLNNMPEANDLSLMIQNSEMVICRSGYSTLMDLHQLKKSNIILIPTPCQPEQNYLAEYWSQKFGANVIYQKDLKKLFF